MAGATSSKVLRTAHWKRLRADWALRIAAGDLVCYRCGQIITAGQPWDLGHVIDRARGGDESSGVAPEHRSCNRSAGAQLALTLRAEREQQSWPNIVDPSGDDDALFGVPAPARLRRPTPIAKAG